ncbi:Transcription termination factor mitochondrial/chloroplastic [Arabidopsis suecica]|uniref:Transcription termination factor mitochondrial/chloroplastic n=1 Tax=Arabidopsis suecica TaxID=45249 RepID=A0A8T2BNG3_ARASU|nr:Transcription termination factor mitochondrial/chloroplastic [Arabidopsis suecica]
MYSLILHGRKLVELQKWRHLRVSVQKASPLSNYFSSAADASLRDGRKGKTFTVSYLVDSLGLPKKLAESISRKVSFEDKANPDSVLNLLRSHGFTDSQISNIVTDYPTLLIADAEKSLGPKLQFLLSRGASSSELTQIVVEMGFDPTTTKFVKALNVVQGLSHKTIEEKVNICKRLGFFDVCAMFKKHPSFLYFSEKKIFNSVETFLGLGFSRDEFTKIVKKQPICLSYSAESVKKKTEFLVKKMNWPLKAVVLNPSILGYSLEKRIVPRCNIIKTLISKGLLEDRGGQLPPMRPVLMSTDQDFLNLYVRKHVDKELVAELMSIFTGDHAS